MNEDNLLINKNPNFKEKLKQAFCRHKSISEYKKNELFFNLNGTVTVYRICDKCNKIIETYARQEHY